jgi:transcriptional regulator with XRE-family HTH domain
MLYHQQGLTMRQVAELLSVDESRVSQLHSVALVRLKANVDSLLHLGQAEGSGTGTQSCTAVPGPNASSSVTAIQIGSGRTSRRCPRVLTKRAHVGC